MDRQQVIVLVLATVVVGVSVVLGINVFTENAAKSNYNVLIRDAMRIANDAQTWKQKPEVFGGQSDTYKEDLDNFTGATLVALGYAPNDGSVYECYGNSNGIFKITNTDNGVEVQAWNEDYGNLVVVRVSGTRDADIAVADASVRGAADLNTLDCKGATYGVGPALEATPPLDDE